MADQKITELTAWNTPIDTDVLPIVDIAAGVTKKISWQYIKSVLKTYFDGIYSSAVKTSSAEVDTGTDDAKFVTAAAISGSHNVPNAVPGTTGNVLKSDGTDWISGVAPAGDTWLKVQVFS